MVNRLFGLLVVGMVCALFWMGALAGLRLIWPEIPGWLIWVVGAAAAVITVWMVLLCQAGREEYE
jgi:hypothetical protein